LTLFNSKPDQRLTADEIEVRIWAVVVLAVTLILLVIVIALLYSVTFVTQPIKAMAPIDQAYTKMLNDIVLLIVGGIGGVITKRATKEAAQMMAAVKAPPPPPMPTFGMQPMPYGAAPQYTATFPQNSSTVQFNNAWTPPPAPTNPPHYLEDDDERERLAAARQTTKGQ